MAMTMSKTLRVSPVMEAAVVLTLETPQAISRAALEEAAISVERILDEHVSQITRGASGCADFEHERIEIDMVLTGDSPAELHRQLAIVIGTLEQHCALDVAGNQLMLTSSTTQVAQPHSVAA